MCIIIIIIAFDILLALGKRIVGSPSFTKLHKNKMRTADRFSVHRGAVRYGVAGGGGEDGAVWGGCFNDDCTYETLWAVCPKLAVDQATRSAYRRAALVRIPGND